MKNLFVLLLISLLTFTTVSAATTISTDIVTGGKIGIGSTTPYSKLSIDASGADTNPFSIKTNGSAGNYIPANSGIFMYDAAGAETLRIYASDPDDSNNYNSGNLFIGRLSGFNIHTDNVSGGYSNVGVGLRSLFSITTGSSNVAIGLYALDENTTGFSNTASGYSSLYSNTTGGYNSAYGELSLGRNISATSSTAVGSSAGRGITSYSNQGGTYVGYQSGYSAGNSSDYNTLIGYQSGYGITTGKNNIVLGTATSSTSINNITTGSQNILIGNNIGLPSSTASGQLNIGNIIYGVGVTGTGSTLSNARIGLGISNPTSMFQVASSTTNATSTIEIGRTGQNKGSCLVLYDAAGTAVYAYIATAATTFTLSSLSCK